jgi:hypothetical protein
MLCSFVDRHQYFEAISCLHHYGSFFRTYNLDMEATGSFITLVSVYQIIRLSIPEDPVRNIDRHGNTNSQNYIELNYRPGYLPCLMWFPVSLLKPQNSNTELVSLNWRRLHHPISIHYHLSVSLFPNIFSYFRYLGYKLPRLLNISDIKSC